MTKARTIVLALGGRWFGSYGMVKCVAHNDGGSPALKVSDHCTHDDGVDVVCFAGCDWRQVKAELRRRDLLPQRDARGATNLLSTQVRDQRLKEAEHISRVVNALWKRARPAERSLVAHYLAVRRMIDLAAIGGVPRSIRFQPDLKHRPSGLLFPAMVAAVQGSHRKITGLHRTFLKSDGGDKASVSEVRMMLGHCAGGAVRLDAAAPVLAIGEGIETCLAAKQLFRLPTWAALSTSGLRSIDLPDEVREVVILSDNDEPGWLAAKAALERFRREGRSARVEAPAAIFKDFNDQLIDAQWRAA